MIKISIGIVIGLLISTTAADAQRRQRVTVYPTERERLIYSHPYAVELALSKMLCGFHLFSLGPNPRPGSVGSCANWFHYPQHKPV